MKVIRSTLYSPENLEDAMTTVVRDSDITLPVEDVPAEMDQPGLFAAHQIFEVEDGTDIVAATTEALERWEERKERERNQAIYYYWTAMMFRRARVVANTQPAPLSASELRAAMSALARHPDFDRHSVVSFSEDGEVVTLHGDGRITTENTN